VNTWGCRSFLLPYVDKNGKSKYYGRFNGGVVTVNLPDVALSAIKEVYGKVNEDEFYLTPETEKTFWKILEERVELCHRALRLRYERIASVTSDVAPILWQHGAFARLKPGESVEPLLRDDYATFSLGYAGLFECVKVMTGESHSGGKGKEFGLKVMQRLNDYTNKWRKEERIGYSLYGSPIESTTYKFAKCLRNRFGKIKDITDRNYITNSYHINVREKIDAFSKLAIESEYQALSPGGAISYVEVPNMTNNIPAVISLMKFMYENIMYAEINSKSDYCHKCGYDGEIAIKKEDREDGPYYYWECPNCGNKDQHSLNIARRTCGYIGTQFWNQGRTQEIAERQLHL
jgi:ribonucleoside-triphosphate reductase (formate)